ncbi:GAF domain-containing sensor histidine kinase [Granulicella sp. L60]|uniref:GAF domain-containing sensor histidine kinase n=1 Tax=Granulicella sp. L60 TaxID=1641866 RepID=UPI00131A809E|nr:GAF domain-containing sensor histidine kinase [Granulicella sp. L60]
MYSAPIPEHDVGRVATLHSYAILDTPPEPGYEDVTALASYICSTPYSTITFVDEDRQWFKSEVGFGTHETGRADGFCACAVLQPGLMIVEDTLLDDRFAENPFVVGGPQIRFYAGAPLVAPNGHILGTVCVFDNKPRALDPAQIAALTSLSRQVMSLLQLRLKLAEQERTAAALMQSEKIAAVGRLASSMAHEINNPLEAVTNLLFLTRQKAVDSDSIDWLEQAEKELRRISTITKHTLRFHRQTSFPQAITCLSLFSATLDLYEAKLRNSGILVEKRKRANEPVQCFEGDIRQVLSNVVSNAIDSMPLGGRLIVRSREATEWTTGRKGLALTIADTGHGMSRETERHMFEAFYTTKGIGGNGLGLWISADIMHRHQGTISIKSSQGLACGTVVTLFLPFETFPRTQNATDILRSVPS